MIRRVRRYPTRIVVRTRPVPLRAERPLPLRVKLRAFARPRAHVILAHPHHYATAAGLSGVLWLSGHAEAAALICAWAYAVLENICSALTKEGGA